MCWTYINCDNNSLLVCNVDRVKQKKCLPACAKYMDLHHPAHAQSLIRAFARHWNFYSIQWFCLRTVKALIKLRGCAGWSGASLVAYARRHVGAGRGPCDIMKTSLDQRWRRILQISHRFVSHPALFGSHIFSMAVNKDIRGMFEMNCLFLSGDFKFQVSPKVLISCPRSTPRG